MVTLHTVGHGTLPAEALASLLTGAGMAALVDVRSHPGSRRHPHFARPVLEQWVPETGLAYRWEPRLGGRRRARPGSPHLALRHPSFRGYADHMSGDEFASALDDVLADAAAQPTVVMCAESLWWRCHRRLLADAAVLTRGAEVVHLMHDGSRRPHVVTEGARAAEALVVYDVGVDRPLT